MRNIKYAVLGVVVCVFLTSCATTSKAPKWVDKGAGAFNDKCFYGVGRASENIKDKALRIETADNRARADLQRVFDTYSSALMKDYTGTDGELVERAIKTFSAGHISGAQIVDHYTDSDGMVYTLVKLDLENFKKAMELMKDLSDEAREYVRKKADALFSELQREETKRNLK